MKLLCTTLLLASLPTALAWSQGRTAQSSASGGTSSLSAIGPFVRLQPNSPGAAQVGNSHITGTAMASEFRANNLVGGIGVHGVSASGNGSGVYGEGGTFGAVGIGSAQGVTGQGAFGVVSFGTAHVQGDLVVTGSKTGYVVDLIRNGDSVPLAPGELVEIVGSEPAVLGDIPVAIVQRASAGQGEIPVMVGGR